MLSSDDVPAGFQIIHVMVMVQEFPSMASTLLMEQTLSLSTAGVPTWLRCLM